MLLQANEEPQQTAEERARANSPTSEADITSVRPTRDPATWNWSVPDPMPHVHHGTIHSPSMQREIGYNSFLPPGYEDNPAMRYPVVYFLHGVTGTEKSAAHMVHLVLHELEAGNIGPVIWVYVNGGQFSEYVDWEDSYVKAETYIIHELIPTIDERYRTIADRSGRAISGWSMGGAGSTRFATKYPQMFCAVASISGAFRVMERVDPADDAFAWAAKHPEKIRDQIGITLFCGETDFLIEHNRALTQHLTKLDIPHTYREIPEIGHDLGSLQRLIGHEFIRSLAQYYHPATPEKP